MLRQGRRSLDARRESAPSRAQRVSHGRRRGGQRWDYATSSVASAPAGSSACSRPAREHHDGGICWRSFCAFAFLERGLRCPRRLYRRPSVRIVGLDLPTPISLEVGGEGEDASSDLDDWPFSGILDVSDYELPDKLPLLGRLSTLLRVLTSLPSTAYHEIPLGHSGPAIVHFQPPETITSPCRSSLGA
ncbi:unnamed protein product [Diplocarpon coronariae]